MVVLLVQGLGSDFDMTAMTLQALSNYKDRRCKAL